jgi:hypothetical protein
MIKQVSSPRHRWTQFSLRTLLTIMLVAAAFLAGRTSVQPELERLKAAERDAVGQCVQERVKLMDAVGARIVAEERLRIARVQASEAIRRLQEKLERRELTSR